MAQGNIGSSLDPNNLNTYVSRNGGLDWLEVAKGKHFF